MKAMPLPLLTVMANEVPKLRHLLVIVALAMAQSLVPSLLNPMMLPVLDAILSGHPLSPGSMLPRLPVISSANPVFPMVLFRVPIPANPKLKTPARALALGTGALLPLMSPPAIVRQLRFPIALVLLPMAVPQATATRPLVHPVGLATPIMKAPALPFPPLTRRPLIAQLALASIPLLVPMASLVKLMARFPSGILSNRRAKLAGIGPGTAQFSLNGMALFMDVSPSAADPARALSIASPTLILVASLLSDRMLVPMELASMTTGMVRARALADVPLLRNRHMLVASVAPPAVA